MKDYDNHFVSAMYAVNEDREKRRKRRKNTKQYKKYLNKAARLNYTGYYNKDEDLVVSRKEILVTIDNQLVVREVRQWDYVPVEKPWIKKVWYSGTRKCAKKYTNKRLRNCKDLGTNPGAYRKVFDYWNTLF